MWTKEQFWKVLLYAAIGILIVSIFIIFCEFGTSMLIFIIPVLILGVLADHLFNKNLKNSQGQAEQARRHVEELSHYIAEQERTAKILEKSEEQFRNAFDYAATGMALVSTSGEIKKVNRSFCNIFGYSETQLPNTRYHNYIAPEDKDLFNQHLAQLLSGKAKSRQMEKRIVNKKGDIIWTVWSSSLVHDETGDSAHFIFQINDISDRKRAEEQLVHDALHDSLTNLPNRVLFHDRLENALKRAQRNFDSNFAVLYLDFDRFKPLSSLKIDCSFVMRMAEGNTEIVQTIVSLAQSLNLEIIAEGIETTEQIDVLKKMACNFGQGYFYAKPLDSAKVIELYSGAEDLHLSFIPKLAA